MPVLTHQIPQEAPVSVPIDAYLALQRRIQELRISILGNAARSASGLSEQGIREAFRAIAGSTGNVVRPPNGPLDLREISQDAYLFLERRLHNLRVLVITEAAREVEARQQSKSVDPDDVERVWRRIVADRALLQKVLIPDQWAAAGARR